MPGTLRSPPSSGTLISDTTPSGVDSSLYQPRPFHGAKHECPACPRYCPVVPPLSKTRLASLRSFLDEPDTILSHDSLELKVISPSLLRRTVTFSIFSARHMNSKSHIQIQCNLLFSSNNLKFEVNRRTVSTNWLDGFSPFALNLRHDANPGAPRPPQGPRATPAYAKAACATAACATPACAMPATPPSSRRMSYPHA